ncbi:hypothetical protein FGW37_32705 [Streptomyces rectiverticillatus]|uniref:hypothetical protein n=1 Tax=Streptomyces rectiverticillatus TaxID=173860 RepID=UPI0015C359D3|nr:hypothetical protein [Streptomyces rectiverticillatus]QLE75717.1 hypothetical protein FGW37_32705 [Streptomyces rectiverticillatus]
MTTQEAVSTTNQRPAQVTRAVHRRMEHAGESIAAWRTVTVVARLALASGFLSAVADRCGLWGEFGTGNVAWGTFDAFVTNTGTLAPYLSGGGLRAAAVAATVAELLLGLALLFGVAVRWTAWLSAATLLVFGLSMALFKGPQAPLIFSVFSALAAAAMLAMAPRGAMALTLDRRLTRYGRSRSRGQGVR